MVSKELLDILLCPESHQALTEAPADLVARLNAAVRVGTLRNRAGEKVERMLDGALVRQDQTVAYPIVDGIPVMLADEAIGLDSLSS